MLWAVCDKKHAEEDDDPGRRRDPPQPTCPVFSQRGRCSLGSACLWPHPTRPAAQQPTNSVTQQSTLPGPSSMSVHPDRIRNLPSNLVFGAPAAALSLPASRTTTTTTTKASYGPDRFRRDGLFRHHPRRDHRPPSHPQHHHNRHQRQAPHHTGSGRTAPTNSGATAPTNSGATAPTNELHDVRQVHNLIKRSLLDTYGVKGGTCLDLASGRGGDLKKFMHLRAVRVWCVDVNSENMDEAKHRLTNDPELKQLAAAAQCQVSFVVADLNNCGQADALYWRHLPDGQIDTASCFFALHYFARSVDHLALVLTRVASKLCPGAYFVGCCPDGDHIQGSPDDTSLATAHMSIRRLPAAADGEQPRIVMTLSDSIIQQGSEEYVITRQCLGSAATRAGLVVHSIDNFTTWLDVLSSAPQVHKDERLQRCLDNTQSSPSLLRTSMVNMSFVLQKPKTVKPVIVGEEPSLPYV